MSERRSLSYLYSYIVVKACVLVAVLPCLAVLRLFVLAYIYFNMASCKVCLVAFKNNPFKVECQDCAEEFHGKCVNINKQDIKYLTEQGANYRCEPCNKKRRQSMRLEYAQEGMTLEMIMQTLKEMQGEQKKNTAVFNKSSNTLHNTIEENTVTLREGMGKIQEYIKEIDLGTEN